MTRHTFSLMLLLFSLLLLPIFSFGAQAENEPVESLLAAAIQENCPDCQLLDYAPIGQEQTEYIILTLDSEEKPAVMIVNTEQPAAGVAVRNDKILEGIPLDTGTVQIQDHMLDGYPYIEYRAADDSEFLYVVFHKNESGIWQVHKAQFGDEWYDLYWFRYEDRDQKLHIYLTGDELVALSGDAISILAEDFDPAEARACLRDELAPFLLNQEPKEYDKTAEECRNAAWLMNGTAYDDLLENLAGRVASRQIYAVTGTVRYVIPGTIQRAVFDISDDWVPFSLLISNLSDTEWTEGSTYMLYVEAYAYSETERIPWLLAGYTQ